MGCIYTPRGLKVFIDVEDAMIYLSRFSLDYSPFSGLQLVESIFNIPSFTCFVGSVLSCFFCHSIWTFVISVVVSRIIGNLIFGFQSLALCFTRIFYWPLKMFDIISGRGMLLSVVIGLSFAAGGWKFAVAYLVTNTILYFGYMNAVNPEKAFRYAYLFMAHRCGVTKDLEIDNAERDSLSWAACYSDLSRCWPEIVSRFEYEDTFFINLSSVINRSRSDLLR